jgi:hypothetical protein
MGITTRTFANNIKTSGCFDDTKLTGNLPTSNVDNTSVTCVTAIPGLPGFFTQNPANILITGFCSLTSDPTPLSAGQIWYNTTTNTLCAAVCCNYSVWTSQPAMNVGRNVAGAGTNTAALAFGGTIVYNATSACTESYNGSTWTTGGALGTGRDKLAGAGTSNTAALAFGGYWCKVTTTPTTCTLTSVIVACTESYNGSTWTAGGAMGTARCSLAGAGTNTAALAFGGQSTTVSTSVVACTESYNGSTWTTGGVMGTARYYLAGTGASNTSVLAFGGWLTYNTAVACTESYNGSTWTAKTVMNTARGCLAGAGTNTAALAFGGYSGPPTYTALACTELYNGSAWTAVGVLGTARYGLAGAGPNTAALAFGGRIPTSPSIVACTELFCNILGIFKTKVITF